MFDCRSGKSRKRTNTEGLKITKELSQTPLLQTLRGVGGGEGIGSVLIEGVESRENVRAFFPQGQK